MTIACDAEVCGRFLLSGDTSNTPLEWTGHQMHVADATPGSLPATQGQR